MSCSLCSENGGHFKPKYGGHFDRFFQIDEQNIVQIREKITEKRNIKQIIENSNWYLSKWDLDPSVNGMLVMLQQFEKEFKKKKFTNFDDLDLEKIDISFDFLDLDSLNQTDDLYVKMNARGKQLTDFEHFKAWLQDVTEKKYSDEKEFLTEFWRKIDTTWMNFFWKSSDSDFSAIDDLYYNFLKNLALMSYFSRLRKNNSERNRKLYDLIRNSEKYDISKINYVPLDTFINNEEIVVDDIEEISENQSEKTVSQNVKKNLNKLVVFDIESLKFIGKVLDLLCDGDKISNYLKYLKEDILVPPFVDFPIEKSFVNKENFTVDLTNSVFYFAIINYIINDSQPDFDNFRNWARVARNLIYNTYIQTPDNFISALSQVNELIAHKDQFLIKLKEGRYNNRFFYDSQFTEERRKVDLIEDDSWKESIIQAENHSYFYGQINFMLDWSAIDVEDFRKKSEIMAILFSKEILDHKEYLLQRGLFSLGEYLLDLGNHSYSFCNTSTSSLRNRNDNWRKVFDGNSSNNIFRNKILCDLVQKVQNSITFYNEENIAKFLKQLCCDYNPKEKNDWKQYFIENPFIIDSCQVWEIKKFNNHDVRLLGTSSIIGYHLELRTTDLYSRLELNEYSVEFIWDRYNDGHPGLMLNFSIDNQQYKIEIRYFGKYEFNEKINPEIFELKLYRSTKSKVKEFADNLIENLQEFGFLPFDKDLVAVVPHSEIIEKLRLISKKLNNYAIN